MSSEAIILIVLFLFAATGLGVVVGITLNKMGDLGRRVGELERCQAKRLPFRTADGVEDALAVNIDLVRYAQELQLESETLQRRAEQQAAILRLVRQGPDAYDSDRPAGARPGKERNL